NIVNCFFNMPKILRVREYTILLYRLLLVYIFYLLARLLFFFYNKSVLNVDGPLEFLHLAYRGLAFDTAAILYVNAAFILFSILPFFINTSWGYQKFLFFLYFGFNLTAYALN